MDPPFFLPAARGSICSRPNQEENAILNTLLDSLCRCDTIRAAITGKISCSSAATTLRAPKCCSRWLSGEEEKAQLCLQAATGARVVDGQIIVGSAHAKRPHSRSSSSSSSRRDAIENSISSKECFSCASCVLCVSCLHIPVSRRMLVGSRLGARGNGNGNGNGAIPPRKWMHEWLVNGRMAKESNRPCSSFPNPERLHQLLKQYDRCGTRLFLSRSDWPSYPETG